MQPTVIQSRNLTSKPKVHYPHKALRCSRSPTGVLSELTCLAPHGGLSELTCLAPTVVKGYQITNLLKLGAVLCFVVFGKCI